MSALRFKLAARTDMGLVRTNNEDNFQVIADLGTTTLSWTNDQVYELPQKGTLLVVADGMGGMNAGEVASEIAVSTVKEWFAPQRITDDVVRNRFTIERFMNDAIVEADRRIKLTAQQQPETRGMGTTLVIAWIFNGELYVSWCGDSRAYIYNPQAGLHQITKDHSYVQQLVDKGALTRDEAFDFPDSNIITRSLSDSPVVAKPESLLKPFQLADGDIIMLCTDGLCGMIRDCDTEYIPQRAGDSLDALLDALIQGAYAGGGSDNVTICLCQVLSGGIDCDPTVYDDTERRLNGNVSPIQQTIDTLSRGASFWHGRKGLITAGALVVAILIIATAIFLWPRPEPQTVQEDECVGTDSIITEVTEEIGATAEEEVSSSPEETAEDESNLTQSSGDQKHKKSSKKKRAKESSDQLTETPGLRNDNSGSSNKEGTDQSQTKQPKSSDENTKPNSDILETTGEGDELTLTPNDNNTNAEQE